jgi:hypothetical protein
MASISIEQENHAVPGMTVLKRCIIETDDSHAGGPEAVSLMERDIVPNLCLSDSVICIFSNPGKTTIHFQEGLCCQLRSTASAGHAIYIMESIETCRAIKHSEEIPVMEEDIFIVFATTLLMQDLHLIRRCGDIWGES